MLIEGLGEKFARDFLITHFFNPPRYMRLLEIVKGPKTRADAVATIEEFCDIRLGKGVIHAKDTPGFIANRIGGMWVQSALQSAFDLGLSVEEADAIMGRPFGMPRTGIFGLMDLVGIEEIDLFVYHQANGRILTAVGERLGLPAERVVDCIAEHGNTSAATLPLALAVSEADGRLRPGSRVLLGAFGAGFTWGATVVRWAPGEAT